MFFKTVGNCVFMANNENENTKITRRSFIGSFATFVVAAPVLLSVRNLFAAKDIPPPPGPKPVEETHPLAIAFSYHKDTSKVDATKFPLHKPDQHCNNCAKYTKLNEGWGKCQIIAAGPVASGGWCKQWAAKK